MPPCIYSLHCVEFVLNVIEFIFFMGDIIGNWDMKQIRVEVVRFYIKIMILGIVTLIVLTHDLQSFGTRSILKL